MWDFKNKNFEDMTLKELENKVVVQSKGCGQYKIAIEYRGKTYHCNSNDSLAYDSLPKCCNSGGCWDDSNLPMTYNQALKSFYDECKRKNNLT